MLSTFYDKHININRPSNVVTCTHKTHHDKSLNIAAKQNTRCVQWHAILWFRSNFNHFLCNYLFIAGSHNVAQSTNIDVEHQASAIKRWLHEFCLYLVDLVTNDIVVEGSPERQDFFFYRRLIFVWYAMFLFGGKKTQKKMDSTLEEESFCVFSEGARTINDDL